MKKCIALIAAVVIFFGFVFVYENLNVSKKSLFVSGSAVLSEKDNKRFYGSKTFDKIAYEYEDAILLIVDIIMLIIVIRINQTAKMLFHLIRIIP